MAGIIDKMIVEFSTVSGGQYNPIVAALQAKKAELGEGVTESEEMVAVQQILSEQLRIMVGSKDPEDTLNEEDKAFMDNACAVVQEFMDANEWRYTCRSVRANVRLFELSFRLRSCSVRVRIHVEVNPHVCRIDAILPITADSTYEYPLCAAVAKANFSKRFGSMKYDHRDGELSYEYSYPITHGLYADDLERIFQAIVSTAASIHDEIRKYCTGKFRKDDISDILQKVNALVNDITAE